jgi:hypothetical protein
MGVEDPGRAASLCCDGESQICVLLMSRRASHERGRHATRMAAAAVARGSAEVPRDASRIPTCRFRCSRGAVSEGPARRSGGRSARFAVRPGLSRAIQNCGRVTNRLDSQGGDALPKPGLGPERRISCEASTDDFRAVRPGNPCVCPGSLSDGRRIGEDGSPLMQAGQNLALRRP